MALVQNSSAAPAVVGKHRPAIALLLSADSADALREVARQWAGRLARPDTRLEDAALGAAVRQDYFRHRFAFTAASSAEAVATLEAFARRGTAPPGGSGICPPSRTKLAFVFSGLGSHWAGMGRSLLDEPAFRIAAERCDAVAKAIVGISVIDELLRPDAQSRLDTPRIGAIAVFTVQIALASLWKSIGIVPDLVVGHSHGEVAAAHVAGALELEDAALISAHCGLLMQRLAGTGKVAVIRAPPEKVARMLGARESKVWIAGASSPGATVVAGDPNGVAEIVAAFGRRGIFTRQSRLEIAFHTPHLDLLLPGLVAAVRSIRSGACDVPLVSSARGRCVDGEELDAGFWGELLRHPFSLPRAVSAAIGEGANLFVEISPHPVIAAGIAESLSAMSCNVPVLASMRRAVDGRRHFLDAACTLYAAGCRVSLEGFFTRDSRRKT